MKWSALWRFGSLLNIFECVVQNAMCNVHMRILYTMQRAFLCNPAESSCRTPKRDVDVVVVDLRYFPLSDSHKRSLPFNISVMCRKYEIPYQNPAFVASFPRNISNKSGWRLRICFRNWPRMFSVRWRRMRRDDTICCVYICTSSASLSSLVAVVVAIAMGAKCDALLGVI